MMIAETVVFQGRTNPHRPAMIWADRIVTYGMLADAIGWVARRAHAAGIKPGDTVAIASDNPIRDVIATLALMRLGAVSASVRDDQAGDLARMGASAILTHRPGEPVGGIRRVIMDDGWFTPTDLPLPPADAAFDDPARICRISTTSGTTGFAQIVAATLGETHARMRYSASCHWAGGSDRILLLVGMSILWGFNEAMRALSFGSTICFAATGEEALRAIDLFQVDSIFAAPQQVRALMDAMDELPGTCETVKFISLAGSLITPAFGDEMQRRVGRTIAVSYGSTEAGKIAAAPFERLRDIPGAVGYILPGRQIEIVDEQDKALPPGTEGILRIMAVAGGQPYTAGELYPDRSLSWFYPGDLGTLREDGLLTITGRIDEVLNAGGAKVAPEIIDQLVARRADVADCAAFGVAGSSGIPEIWLAIIAKRSIRDDELIAWCEARLPETPINHVVRVDAIPRNAMGKVERVRLKNELTR
jgi:acyl-coenzyme A synthetase/AMP-(fatty) acid ligase